MFFAELKRRNVVKVGIAYAIVSWLLIQVTDIVVPALRLPEWTVTFIVYLLIIGFALALFLAWAYELTPEGIKPTKEVEPGESITHLTEQKLNYIVTGLLVLAVAFMAIDNYVLKKAPQVTEEQAAIPAVTETVTTTPNAIEEQAPAALPNSIAVLPFTNMSDDKANEYFADGIAEELLNALARIPALEVRGRTSSFYFKDRKEDLRTISAMLNVAYILEGSVRKAGEQVRITVQLINTRTDNHIWSETYERTLDDIFVIQDEIASAVVGALEISLGVAQLSHIPGMTRNVRAYDMYLKVAAMDLAQPDILRNMIQLLEEAVNIDPGFAVAWNRLGELYGASNIFIPGGLLDWEVKRDQAYARARELIPDAPYVLGRLAEASALSGDWIEAGRLFSKMETAATQYGVNSQHLIDRAWFLAYSGRCRESLAIFKQARALDPLNEDLVLSDIYSKVGDLRAALAEADRALELGTTSINLIADGFVIALAARDRTEIEKRYALLPAVDVTGRPINNIMMKLLDDEKTARETLHGWKMQPEYQTPFQQAIIAMWAAYYGDRELALDRLRSLPRQAAALFNLVWRPIFSDMRKLPGFKDLMREVGLVDYWRTTGKWSDFCHPIGEDDFECE